MSFVAVLWSYWRVKLTDLKSNDLLSRIPKKLLVFLSIVSFVLFSGLLLYVILVQNKSVSFWGIQIGETQDKLRERALKAEDELSKRIPATTYETVKKRASELEREIETNKKIIAELKAELAARERSLRSFSSDAEKVKEYKKEIDGLHVQSADLKNKLDVETRGRTTLQKRSEAAETQLRAFASELAELKRAQGRVFTVQVGGQYQSITIWEGDGVQGDSTILNGVRKESVVAVPKNRPVHIGITGHNNTIFVPPIVLQRMTTKDEGLYNDIKPYTQK
jgi:hypothetical protein